MQSLQGKQVVKQRKEKGYEGHDLRRFVLSPSEKRAVELIRLIRYV